MNTTWIDISVPLQTGMVHWPGDPAVQIARTSDIARGDHANVSTIVMGAHTGTHIDAPLHFLEAGAGIGEMPLEAVIGPARVVAVPDRRIGRAALEALDPQPGERLLFKTSNSDADWVLHPFQEDFAHIALDGAELLAARGVRTVGVDYLSVGGFRTDGTAVHRTLLGAGIWIIEGLRLLHVPPGAYDLICLPLRLVHGDGAPARAVLRPR
ncbi:MAG: cyclase family protein [Acidimicrobiia bacterium]|nr:cyclase family protein [Acidimicrobiia bacterium]